MNEDRMTTWERLTAYFDGELNRDERLEMEQLLFENPEYAHALREWKELRSELQAMPLQSLADQRDAEARSRKVMDNIFETIAAGDVQWDSRPVDLDQYYKLQAGELDRSQNDSWSKDFRKLHPADRMRRWQWQLTALASVAALLLLSLFLKQNNDELMTGMTSGEAAAEMPLSDDASSLNAAVANRSGHADEPAGGLTEMADDQGGRPNESLPPIAMESGLAMKSAAPKTGALKTGAPMKSSDAVESMASESIVSESIASNASQSKGGGQFGSKGQAAPAQRAAIPDNPQVPFGQAGSGQFGKIDHSDVAMSEETMPEVDNVQSNLGMPNSDRSEVIPDFENVGIVLFSIDDPESSLAKLDSILVANGFGNVQDLIDYEADEEAIQSTRRSVEDHLDPVVAGLVPVDRVELPGILLSGRMEAIVKTVNEFRDSGNSIAFMSRLPIGEVPKAKIATASLPNFSQSPVMGQQLEIFRNVVPDEESQGFPIVTDVESLFAIDSKPRTVEKRKPFPLAPDLGPAQRNAQEPANDRRRSFQEIQEAADAGQEQTDVNQQSQSAEVNQSNLDNEAQALKAEQAGPKVHVILLLQSLRSKN